MSKLKQHALECLSSALNHQEIITPVTELTLHALWVNYLVIVAKPNKLEMCLDTHDLDKAII